MALMDGLLRDGLFENIVRSEVYIALRSDLKNDSTRFGAGTADDPYDGSRVDLGGGSYFYKLDKILRDFVPPNTTILLGPGEFSTRGYRDSSIDGWTPKAGWRIVGGGWAGVVSATTKGPTVLKLEGHDSPGPKCAIGMNVNGAGVDGLEIAYIGIDCNLPGDTYTYASGVDVSGSHLRIHHCEIFNFGARSNDPIFSTAARISHPGTGDVFDAVMHDCVIGPPSSNCNSLATVTGVELIATAGNGYFHRACVVRQNHINCAGASGTFLGVSARGGVGTILEQNRIFNCMTGVMVFDDMASALPITKDLIIRDNVFFNVINGVYLKLTSDPPAPPPYLIGRLVILQNIIDLSTNANPTTPTGINITSSAASKTQSIVQQLFVRQNVIRHTNGEVGPVGSIGITLECVDMAVVDENIINIGDVPDSPAVTKGIVRTSTVKKIKTFNNQSVAGVFIPCWNSTALLRDGDPITDMEDSLIGLL